MPTVSVKHGATWQIPNQDFGTFRTEVTIFGIDTEGDVDAQVKQALEALNKVSEGAEEGLAQAAANVSGLSIEGLGLSSNFEEFRGKVRDAMKKLADELKTQRGNVSDLQDKVKGVLGRGATVSEEGAEPEGGGEQPGAAATATKDDAKAKRAEQRRVRRERRKAAQAEAGGGGD